MKKALFLLIALACSLCTMAQKEDDMYNYVPKKKSSKHPFNSSISGNLFKKSDTAKYVAIGTGTVTIGCLVYAGLESVRKMPDNVKMDETANWADDRNNRVKIAYIGAGIFGAAAIISEIVSVKYRIDARREIRLSSTGQGVGLAFTF